MSEPYFDDEKKAPSVTEVLPTTTHDKASAPTRNIGLWIFRAWHLFSLLWSLRQMYHYVTPSSVFKGENELEAICPQQQPLTPLAHSKVVDNLMATYSTSDFEKKAIEWLGDAVRIPCVFFLFS